MTTAGDAQDAARYRWLISPAADPRNAINTTKKQRERVYLVWQLHGNDNVDKSIIDAAIDAAMKGQA